MSDPVTVATVVGAAASVVGAWYGILQYQNAKGQSKSNVAERASDLKDNSIDDGPFFVTGTINAKTQWIEPKGFADKILSVGSYGRENPGINVRSFDWDRNSKIYTPSDLRLGYDSWDIAHGKHVDFVQYAEEPGGSFATLYIALLKSGVLYGNGDPFYHFSKYDRIKGFPFEIDSPQDGFGVSRDRTTLAFVPRDRKEVLIIKTDYSEDAEYQYYSTELNDDCYSQSVYFSPFQGSNEQFFVFQHQASMEDMPEQALTRHNFDSCLQTHSVRLKGLQNIAVSPAGDLLLVVCTKELVVFSANDLVVLKRLPLSGPREHETYVCPPLVFSPCGRHVALSYSISGEIEIFDSSELRSTTTVPTDSLPAGPLLWSPDGRYLSGLFAHKGTGVSKLYIWSMPDGKLEQTLDEVALLHRFRAHCLHPNTIYWHDSRSELCVLMNSGKILRLALKS